jgi:hypothetical protein
MPLILKGVELQWWIIGISTICLAISFAWNRKFASGQHAELTQLKKQVQDQRATIADLQQQLTRAPRAAAVSAAAPNAPPVAPSLAANAPNAPPMAPTMAPPMAPAVGAPNAPLAPGPRQQQRTRVPVTDATVFMSLLLMYIVVSCSALC